ncbi:hypothetical protein N7468_001316 [Penicillium chermesinum]|uniref:NWD NACHT-NTPase N-terminal domain-containing protein n=1 Tax=Penicillium chermesinum TaxID=63820 RepID=A0A9W9PGC4_9EURO|nr:uncharacterized protein N7468_001316 [Penicillium chermesinum]KAJ5246333.1 hypothetical protein N7468_001316 [Penicillium chermesinum]
MPFLSHVKKVFSSSRKRDGAQIQQGPAQTSANGQPAQSPASNPAAPSNSALDQPPVVDNEAPAAPGIQLFKLGNLWEEAYGQIETKSPKLIDAYKQSLLQTNETSPDLQSLINDKLAEIQNARTKITVAGREIVVRDKVQRTINSILSAGGLIGGVISAEPHAALAWAGLLVLLTPISKTISQGDDAVDGFEEISSILIRYRVIETTPIDLSATSKIPGTTTSLEELANSIKTQTIKLYAAILEYQIRLAKHLSKSRLLRLAEDVAATDDWHEMFQLITHLDETIQSRWKILDGQVLRKVESEVVAIQEKIALSMNIMSEVRDEAKAIRQEQLLNSLEVARGARFDSFDDQHKPCCLEGTQVDTLQQIQAWLESTDSEAMYWLAGMAGTGKSTISRTVASACCHRTPLGNQTAFPENVFLGGVFFFDKNEGDRSTARKLFTTLCKCLTEHLPGIKSDVSDYISSHPNIGNESISSQWKNLILDPLQKFDKKNLVSFTLVLVIDALDECESEDDIGIMLQLFSQVHILSTISLRFFVTSRPEATIQSSFDSVVDVAVLRKELQKVALSIGTGNSVDDITRFLLHGIEQIAQRHSLTMGWPGKENVQKLSFKSDGLFIYAATACRFLGESRITRNQRDARLKSILEGKVNEKSPQGNLDKMYMQILETSVTGDAIDEEREQLCELFRNIVGALINLVEPLSMDHLANLLSLEFSDVSEILERLYSVLSFGENRTSPVTLVHLSFRDFLLDEHRCLESGFLIRQKEAHTILLHQCLAALSDTLKENICLLPKPSSRATDVDLQVLEKNISRHVQYASLHWVVHLRGASINPVDGSEVHEFLEIHILHWLESLSLMQKMSDGVSQVLLLAEYIEALPAEGRGELRSLISDIKRFLLSFRIMVEETPLQIYTAAIAYSPKTSSVRKLFESRMLASIGRPPVAKKHWDSWQHSLSESQSSSISFSPDGKMVASDTARVWDTKTGTLLNTFDNSSYGKFVKFSHDGKMIICLSTDGIFRTWNVYTGVKEKEIRIKKPEPSGKTLSVTSVLLSHDQSLGVVGTFSGEVYVCDLENGDAITRIHQNSGNSSGKVTLIALSNDKTMVAFSKKDGSLIIRDTRSGAICEGFHGTFQARRLRPVGNFLFK